MVMLVPEHTLTNTEDWLHLLEWRSLKLPRVARSSLAAEAQAAASAADPTDFICKFYSYLEDPNRKLGDLLGQESSLRPVLVTDAKALYDSYHRESVTSSVTDRRIALEIRVIKELAMELKGELRWVSSECQWADGLTKLSARQLLWTPSSWKSWILLGSKLRGGEEENGCRETAEHGCACSTSSKETPKDRRGCDGRRS